MNRREQRIVSPTGQGALNMSRSLGDPAYKQPHRLVSCEPTVKSIELTCASCCKNPSELMLLVTCQQGAITS